MSFRLARPVRFSPAGLSDSLDETDLFPGACSSLQNLIPDPTTKNIWTCRPGSTEATTFTGFTTPGVVSVYKVIGSLVFGLVASGLTSGKDQPFCYNIATSAFVSISGVTSSNVPTTQAAAGDWTPPTMDLCGTNLVVTHPGFDGVTNFFGWFDLSTLSTPVWHAGNTASGSAITFATIPTWVRQFNGRAYFGVNPASGQPSVVFTDTLTLKVTNGTQALTFGDNLPLTACIGLPLSNQLGGIIQSLMVFKAAQGIEQITGDAALSNLTVNSLNVATGTLSPRSLCTSPKGILFLAPDGFRAIDFNAAVSDPIGVAGSGVTAPFRAPVAPSRVAAGCNAQVLRCSVENSNAPNTPWQEYWYDLSRQVWSGPHTFPATMYDTYQAQFVMASQAVAASLWLGKVVPDPTTTTQENGANLSWVMQTVMWADNNEMAESEICEMQVKTSAVAGVNNINVSIVDENGSPIATAFYPFSAQASLWGSATWGNFLWGGPVSAIAARQITFSAPVVFNRMGVNISGPSGQGFQIGDIFIRRRTLGYLQPSV